MFMRRFAEAVIRPGDFCKVGESVEIESFARITADVVWFDEVLCSRLCDSDVRSRVGAGSVVGSKPGAGR